MYFFMKYNNDENTNSNNTKFMLIELTNKHEEVRKWRRKSYCMWMWKSYWSISEQHSLRNAELSIVLILAGKRNIFLKFIIATR